MRTDLAHLGSQPRRCRLRLGIWLLLASHAFYVIALAILLMHAT